MGGAAAQVRSAVALFVFAIAVVGCADSPPHDVDAGTDAGIPDPADDPRLTAPTPPAAPAFSECPEGWQSRELAGGTVCSPWPDGEGPAVCPTGQARFPGRPGCEAVGPACPTGAFADDLPTDQTVWYVQPGQTGPGSRTEPFGSIAQATQAASAGHFIALSKGTFDEAVRLPAGVTLVGACIAETLLTSDGSTQDGVIQVIDGPARVERLSITGDTDGIYATANLELDSVEIDGVRNAALYIGGAQVRGERVVLRRTRPMIDNPDTGGFGIEANLEADVELSWVAIEDAGRHPLVALGGSRIRLVDAVVAQAGTAATVGTPIAVASTLELERAAIHESSLNGITVDGASTLVAKDIWVEGTHPREDGVGSGILVSSSAATIERAVLLDNPNAALSVTGSTARLDGADLAIERIRATKGIGVGLLVSDDAVAEVSRASVWEAAGGAIVLQARGSATLTDIHIADVVPAELGIGLGLSIGEGSQLVVDRMVVTDVVSGMSLDGERATLRDVRITDTADTCFAAGEGLLLDARRLELSGCGELAVAIRGDGTDVSFANLLVRDGQSRGFQITEGATGSVTTAAFESLFDTAIAAYREGTSLTLTDVEVRDMSSNPTTGAHGYGIYASGGAAIGGETISIVRARGIGVLSNDAAIVALVDVHIEETLRAECIAPDCLPLGVGASALHGGDLALTGFSIEDSALCGAQVALDGRLSIREGMVASNPIGLNVQTDDYDFDANMSNVEFIDNDRTIDAAQLPVPATGPAAHEPD